MKIGILLFTMAVCLISNQAFASTSGKYRIESAESVVDRNGDRLCVAIMGTNVFGRVGDLVNVTLSDSEFSVFQDLDFPAGVSLSSGHQQQKPGPAGSILVTDGEISDTSALFQIRDLNSSAQETVSVDILGDQIQLHVQRPASALETCTLSKVGL